MTDEAGSYFHGNVPPGKLEVQIPHRKTVQNWTKKKRPHADSFLSPDSLRSSPYLNAFRSFRKTDTRGTPERAPVSVPISRPTSVPDPAPLSGFRVCSSEPPESSFRIFPSEKGRRLVSPDHSFLSPGRFSGGKVWGSWIWTMLPASFSL
nr:hypothetical protein [Bacillaceae bacterium]